MFSRPTISLASQLLYCGKVVSGVTMVIMKKLRGTLTTLDNVPASEALLNVIGSTKISSHPLTHDMVHCDMRKSNVVKLPSNTKWEGGGRATSVSSLVDFDRTAESGHPN